MRKPFIALLAAAGMLAGGTESVDSGNLAGAANFETSLAPWSVAGWIKARGEAHAQNGILALTNTDFTQQTVVYRRFPVEPDQTYLLSVRMRGAIVPAPGGSRAGAWLEITTDKGRKYLAGGSAAGRFQAVSGEFDWKEYRVEFTIPPEQKEIAVLFQFFKATGKAEFRDFALRKKVMETRAGVAVQLVSSVWDNHVVYLAAKMPAPLLVDLRMSRPDNGLKIELDLPHGVKALAGAPWRLSRKDSSGRLRFDGNAMQIEPAKRDGFKTCRFEPPAGYAGTLLPDALRWQNYYRIYVRAEIPRKDLRAFVRIADKTGKVLTELPFTLQVTPELPPLPVPLERFQFHMTYLDALHAPLPEIRDFYTKFWLALAKRPSTSPVLRFGEMPGEIQNSIRNKFDLIVFFGCTPTSILGLGMPLPAEMPKLVYDTGRIEPKLACPRESGNPESPLWTKYTVQKIRALLKNAQPDSPLMFDYEPGSPLNHCFCEGCRKEFSESVRTPKTLSADEIRANYANQWLQYRVKQNAEIAENFARTVKKYFPGHPAYLCTDPLHVDKPKGYSEWCGLDPRLNDRGNYAVFMNMFYHQGSYFYDNVALNLAKIKTPTFPLVDPTERMEMYYRRYTPDGITLDMLAAAALGCPGFGFWPYDDFDARYMKAILRGVNLIAPHENFYCGGQDVSGKLKLDVLNRAEFEFTDGPLVKKIRIPDLDSALRFRMHRSDGDYLLTVFNYDADNPLICEATIPELAGRDYRVYAVESALKLENASGERFRFEVAPFSVALFRLTPCERPVTGILPAAEVEKHLVEFNKRIRELHRFNQVREGRLFAGWGVLPDLNKPLVKLSDGRRSIYIDPAAEGRITGCFIDSVQDILAEKNHRGMLDELHIYRNAQPLHYRLDALKIVSGAPEATFRATVPLPDTAEPDPKAPAGLEIVKKVRLEKGRIVSEYTIANPASTRRVIPAGARIRHWPRLSTGNGKTSCAADWTLTQEAGKPLIEGAGSGESELVFLTAHAAGVPGELRLRPQPVRCSDKPLRLAVRDGSVRLEIALHPTDAAVGFYTWWSPGSPATVEPLTVEKMLPPGKKFEFTSILDLNR
ncbi:MAG: hypothetical protein BWY31_00391 [Lentisphaerae bacterium ADurb.Bin242]|nr:MAG: hypothetical protein BWY31_00391 [Lentisphaerae bacterium ADurb.Bin242]